MSSLLAMIENDQITFACDTASCNIFFKDNGEREIYRNKDIVRDKVVKIGKDMVFTNGINEMTQFVTTIARGFIDENEHINLNMLSIFLKNNLTNENISNLLRVNTKLAKSIGVGLTVMRYHDGSFEAIQLHTAFEYDLQVVRPENGSLRVSMFGFDCDKIIENSKHIFSKCNKLSDYRSPNLFYQVYQDNYREGVGGYIRVYRFDKAGCTLLEEKKLDEKNLKYYGDTEEKIGTVDNFVTEGNIDAQSGVIAGFDFTSDPVDGGLYYKKDGKYFRISPLSSRNSEGEDNVKYASIDLGTTEADGSIDTNIHLRNDGYARFGKVSTIGSSIRFNDFLRGNEGTETIMYSQNFQINRDGSVNIKSADVPRPLSALKVITDTTGQIMQLDSTTIDNVTSSIAIEYNVDGSISKIGDTLITYQEGN